MKSLQVIAIYLPQYHKIPENDKWWGDGFTEWTNVKKAKSLFNGHIQPRIPLNGYYYDLSDPSELVRQMKMASEYGVDGFCFYHYWFKDGKKLLEKPIESLLKMNKLPNNFMLCWANEPWTRAWDGHKDSTTVLMEQDYGGLDEWEKHFNYLLQFFKRHEYIKIDNKPVFAIYKLGEIPRCRKGLDLWNKLSIECGFNGMYYLLTHRQSSFVEEAHFGSGIYDFEPFSTFYRLSLNEKNKCQRKVWKNNTYRLVYDYRDFCECMVNRYTFGGGVHNLGFFPGWDNSPRIGDRAEIIFINNTPDIFKEYFRVQYERSVSLENPFIFINAWNEWGEGAFIEPDEIYGFGYLEAIYNIKKDYSNDKSPM